MNSHLSKLCDVTMIMCLGVAVDSPTTSRGPTATHPSAPLQWKRRRVCLSPAAGPRARGKAHCSAGQPFPRQHPKRVHPPLQCGHHTGQMSQTRQQVGHC